MSPDAAGGVALSCPHCGRTASADRMAAERLGELLSWYRDARGDWWCVACQWQSGRTPALASGNIPRRPLSRRKRGSRLGLSAVLALDAICLVAIVAAAWAASPILVALGVATICGVCLVIAGTA